MNKDVIKKALKCCCNGDFGTACENCPYLNYPRCNDVLCEDALNLINEQEKEIERLRDENCELTKKLEARLTCDFVKTAQKQAQIDVLNELKTHSYYDDDYMDSYVFVSDIDELINEVQDAEDKG